MEISTIGFTQSTAERFFARLRDSGVERVLDVRLNNTSQLAGFAKAQDLPYLARELVGASYEHEPLLAPTQEMLDELKKRKGEWRAYERTFLALMAERRIESVLSPTSFQRRTALLCSEANPENCHRRLVAEYLAGHWPGMQIVANHLASTGADSRIRVAGINLATLEASHVRDARPRRAWARPRRTGTSEAYANMCSYGRAPINEYGACADGQR
jgi:uncharacterized protein (DUF488 family)